jgi:hypothetical protein
MSLYCGIDLHSTNCYLAVLDEQLRPVLGRRVANSLETILAALAPHRSKSPPWPWNPRSTGTGWWMG